MNLSPSGRLWDIQVNTLGTGVVLGESAWKKRIYLNLLKILGKLVKFSEADTEHDKVAKTKHADAWICQMYFKIFQKQGKKMKEVLRKKFLPSLCTMELLASPRGASL